MQNQIKRWPQDWRNGEHNGIPKCCRVYFLIRTLGWSQFISHHPRMYLIWRAFTRRYKTGNDYIHCPYHGILNKSVMIHRCKERGCPNQRRVMDKVEVAQDGTNFEVLLTDDNGSKTLGIFETEKAAQEAAKTIVADLAWAAEAG